ncbi:MAG: hypothetical protein A3A24_01895 [Candidatus Buchananbacteria bacterium RIFCSPLOWO2_01_FULL_46_12]|uniref:NYN domain-containing protein n=2 Tax=Candidatus Buchananiibacteriota TaxID=1817903 RepID=A0A1G1YT17_9BACT|nr:MAG: hypothetical protein A2744_04545 [Candidatus Buchananbacteria bacterium RIFCSPHIGHO2_01_FULL_44_11]OGY55508.1 MAG: hypothetical protein A3A24_01895 [Candidatus Buchananbacteria bacterium RIFCSPLOWO2_01_FULL_46_12]
MKCSIFIDGNNFYKGAKKLINDNTISLLHFDYTKFCHFLCRSNNYVRARYYIGALSRGGDVKSEEMYANQQRLIGLLQTHNIPTVLGTIIKHPDGSFHEKGVDVRIGIEMIKFARLDEYDQAILISSDTDLVPAVEEVKTFGKEVLYVGFPSNQSFGLTKTSDSLLLLRKDDLMNFFPPTTQKLGI